MPVQIDTGGRIGPKRAAILTAMLEAYYATTDDERQDFDGVIGDDANRILHPGIPRVTALYATDEDLQALADEGFLTWTVDRQRDKRIRLTEKAHAAWRAATQPPVGFDTPE